MQNLNLSKTQLEVLRVLGYQSKFLDKAEIRNSSPPALEMGEEEELAK